ncbi:hypothetical protein L486_02436 [Kwoniella mangroviensis CBS 10435]|uniref:Poly(A) RNA polymerase mitochondrial-like central palm domain-containing protein n=1 Tax=Kwoniella mangroviensis CBS 10435 TaxID=1331196 RepID=A0A1B9IW62_9TREE|nr:hypothetical protein L486_02436 [Kwoniella mangroviensis CBS 10435]
MSHSDTHPQSSSCKDSQLFPTSPPLPPLPTEGELSPYKTYYSQLSPRTHKPYNLLYSPDHDKLQESIIGSWRSSEPSQERKRNMEDLRVLLTNAINETFHPELIDALNGENKRRFEVEIVGSSSWGGEIDNSTDVDLCIVDSALPRGYEPSMWLQSPSSTKIESNTQARRGRYESSQNLPKCYSLKALSDCIEKVGMTHTKRHPLPLPLVKFVDPERKLGCDLQCNDLAGLYNCSLILAYCQTSPYVLRPLIYTIKKWYKYISGKDPKLSNRQNKFKLSSYCLSLICIGYLQHIGQLPNLQEDVIARRYDTIEEMMKDDELIWGEWGRTQGRAFHTSFSNKPKESWKVRDTKMVVAEVIRGFFQYFAQDTIDTKSESTYAESSDHFNPITHIISPLNGGIIPRTLIYNDKIYANLEKDQMTYLKGKGYDPFQISLIMQHYRMAKSLQMEMRMGKGDGGIQSYEWCERKLVVQDPFRWMKNQASGMREEVCDGFFDCIKRTHRKLEELGKKATIEDILTIDMDAIK